MEKEEMEKLKEWMEQEMCDLAFEARKKARDGDGAEAGYYNGKAEAFNTAFAILHTQWEGR
jgi:hypothetical protein